MSALIVDGWLEKSGNWNLASALNVIGIQTVERQAELSLAGNTVTRQDLMNCSVAAAYSLGMGDTCDESVLLVRTPPIALFVCVLGCVEWSDAQLGPGLWHRQPWMKRVLCFQIDEAFPRSNPFHDQDAVWIDIDDPNILVKAQSALLSGGTVNVNCKPLFPDGTDPVVMHTTTQNRPEVIGVIVPMMLWAMKQNP